MQGADDGGAKRELRQANERRVWSRGERNGVKKGGWGGKKKKTRTRTGKDVSNVKEKEGSKRPGSVLIISHER